MRDMGTEMTPIPSQEPSRICTPLGATTSIRSPTSSIPSTPQGVAPAPTPATDEETCKQHGRKRELSEEEQKLKTRREIVELGVQLGKMNIAAWASKAEQAQARTCADKPVDMVELERIEFEKRATAWEEVEKTKHMARYKRDEIQIQVWESQKRAKLEAEMQQIEAQVEQMREQAQSKMMRKISLARQRSEEKRAAAEARKARNAEKAAVQAHYIRTLFLDADFSSTIGTISLAVTGVLTYGLSTLLTDRCGRRPLAGMCLCSFFVGLAFYFQDHDLLQKLTPDFGYIGIMGYIATFSIGLAGLPCIIMSETFPVNIKGSAGSLLSLVYCLVLV